MSTSPVTLFRSFLAPRCRVRPRVQRRGGLGHGPVEKPPGLWAEQHGNCMKLWGKTLICLRKNTDVLRKNMDLFTEKHGKCVETHGKNGVSSVFSQKMFGFLDKFC